MSEYIRLIREYIKGRANEVSIRLDKDDITEIHNLLEIIDDLEAGLNNFDDIVENAWDSAEMF